MGYAFISYSTKNQTSADAVRELFQKNNIDTWMAPYDIPAGSKYASVITKAIRECSCFVLLLTNDSQSSEAVDSEVELAALTFKKSIITIQLEKVMLNDSFTFYIHNKQIVAVKKIEEQTDEIRQILQAVIALTGTKHKENKSSEQEKFYKQPIQIGQKQKNVSKKKQGKLATSILDFKKTVGSNETYSTPIELPMPDNTVCKFELNYKIKLNGMEYLVVSREVSSDAILFFVFKNPEGTANPPVLILEGKKIKKIYKSFAESHSNEYLFTDI